MWRTVKFKAMYQQIQGLNTEEKGLEIGKIWRWIVQNAILINEFQNFCQTAFLYIFDFLVLKNIYICIILFHILSKICSLWHQNSHTLSKTFW